MRTMTMSLCGFALVAAVTIYAAARAATDPLERMTDPRHEPYRVDAKGFVLLKGRSKLLCETVKKLGIDVASYYATWPLDGFGTKNIVTREELKSGCEE